MDTIGVDAMNHNEKEINLEVFRVYSLTRADFETEQEYEDFLEEREMVIYNKVHGINKEEAEELKANFEKVHCQKITSRNAHNMDLRRSHMWKIEPICNQKEKSGLFSNMGDNSILPVKYTDEDFAKEANGRLQNWKESTQEEKDAYSRNYFPWGELLQKGIIELKSFFISPGMETKSQT